MKKAASDSKVKKTLLRNYEVKLKSNSQNHVVHDVACSSSKSNRTRSSQKENELSQPTLCSSAAIANYLSDVQNIQPPPPSASDINSDLGQLSLQMTKKLNFHFNDTIYKNLIELNATIEHSKNKKDRRPSSLTERTKRDLEPNIEDFYEDETEVDTPPSIPVVHPKFRPIKKVEDGRLHKLVAAFEDL